MAITPLPAVPLRSDAPATFVTKADAFLGALNQFATEVDAVGVALTLGATNSTSVTSLLIGVGSKSLTVQTGKSYVAGMTLKIASTASPSNWMLGDITSYVTGTGALVINITSILGSGTVAAWTVSQSAPGGAAIGANADITSLTAITRITFPVVPSLSSNANTLDTYEEGTWTPVLSFAVNTGMTNTASSENGTYTKIGNVVTCKVQLILSTFSAGTASGAARISLPFTVGSNYHTGIVLSSNMTTLFANSAQSVGAASYVNLYGNTAINAAPAVLTPSNFTATSNISFSIVYTV